jgi:hypothetical protein
VRKVLLYLCAMGTTWALVYLFVNGQGTLLLALILGSFFITLAIYRPVTAIYITLAYLMLMGDIRRMRDMVLPHPQQDLLLLLPPVVALILGMPIVLGARLRDKLSKAMYWLLLVMVIEVFNPLQGGISVGFTGALFSIIPVLWFWIGRRYGTPEVAQTFLIKVFLPLAVVAAVLGLCQNFFGFLPWEQAWIDANKETFVILNLGGDNSRSFGYSISPAEYATLLEMAAAAAAAFFFTRSRSLVALFPVFVVPMFLAGGRTVVVKLVFAIALLFAMPKRGRIGGTTLLRLIALMVGGLVLTSVLASRFTAGSPATNSSTAGAAIAHQTAGLSNPLDSQKSTAGMHSQIFLTGIIEGFRLPIGHGLGALTAGSSSGLGSSEIDISDLFKETGLMGGILYLFVVFYACMEVLRYPERAQRETSLPVLMIIMSGLGAWLIGAQYSTSAIWLFLIGCVANPIKGRVRSTASAGPMPAIPLERVAVHG